MITQFTFGTLKINEQLKNEIHIYIIRVVVGELKYVFVKNTE